ncbi:hypothetical protein VTJ04DRAFT_2258 [Mycothermus thermophilus]|uniref:uncharacterized protein n=1 Tax=Humicola insolens TaxID=85995 RepID=UPI0037421602
MPRRTNKIPTQFEELEGLDDFDYPVPPEPKFDVTRRAKRVRIAGNWYQTSHISELHVWEFEELEKPLYNGGRFVNENEGYELIPDDAKGLYRELLAVVKGSPTPATSEARTNSSQRTPGPANEGCGRDGAGQSGAQAEVEELFDDLPISELFSTSGSVESRIKKAEA